MGTRMEVAQLESRLNTEDYRKLQSLFLDPSGARHALSRGEFVSLAWSSVGRGSKEEYGLLFDSVTVAQERRGLILDGAAEKEVERVEWTGLCAFLTLELSNKLRNARTRSVPRWKPPRTLTCPHRDPVQKVLYLQSSAQFLTVSKGGTAELWAGEDTSLLHTHRLQNSTVTAKDLWVTDAVLLHNAQKIAVSFTSKEVCFYDITSKHDFGCKYKLQGLQFTPWCLDYWADPSLPDQAILTIGDIGGQISALCFNSVQISLFERLSRTTDSSSTDIILWEDLVKGKHCCCYTVTHQAHAPAWVRKVRYLGSLDAFLSCSTRPKSSMAIGWRETGSRRLRVTSFLTERGVWDMDHHHGLNLIATAGVDHQVLLWSPYVSSEPVCVLSRHTGSVVAVRFLQAQQQLLSYSKDKELCLWDVSGQQCEYRLTGVFPKTQEDAHTTMFLHEERQLIVLSFNSLLLLLETVREARRTRSHQLPITCVLYNSLFRQVVSSDSGSSVICWRADTGQKVKQFHRCHGNAQISTMALDGTQTRLFTAGGDGEVKVWDFNGRCLHRMNAGLGRAVDVSQVLLLKRSILVMGWERILTVFRLHSFSQSLVQPSVWNGGIQHCGNVLCAALQPPHTLVTGSYDGEIIVWNSSTEKALRKLRPHAEHGYTKQQGNYLDLHISSNGKEDSESCHAVTRVFFIPGRSSVAAAAGGADLVSCGGSGAVRLWNSTHSRLVGQFTAHNGDLGSIVMTVSPCGKYLTTADGEGTIKTWHLQHYGVEPDDGTAGEPPKLLHSCRPHLDRVTHLETCVHNGKLLLLSASSDCNVTLSRLPGDAIGVFGQEEPWWISPGSLSPQQEVKWDRADHRGQHDTRRGWRKSQSETRVDPAHGTSGQTGIKDEAKDNEAVTKRSSAVQNYAEVDSLHFSFPLADDCARFDIQHV